MNRSLSNKTNDIVSNKNVSSELLNKFTTLDKRMKMCHKIIEKGILSGGSGKSDKSKRYKKKLLKYRKLTHDLGYAVHYFKSLADYYFLASLMNAGYYGKLKGKVGHMYNEVNNLRLINKNKEGKIRENNEKLDMLGEQITLIENIIKTPANIDLNMIAKISGDVTKLKAEATTDGEKTISKQIFSGGALFGGADGPGDVGEISADRVINYLEETKDKVLKQFDSIEFLDKKFQSLNKRMRDITAANENLFKIRAQVEFIVNRLGECSDGDCDEGKMKENLRRLYELIGDIEGKIRSAEKDEKLASYVAQLEKYVSTLEGHVKATQKTIGNLDTEKRDEARDYGDTQVDPVIMDEVQEMETLLTTPVEPDESVENPIVRELRERRVSAEERARSARGSISEIMPILSAMNAFLERAEGNEDGGQLGGTLVGGNPVESLEDLEQRLKKIGTAYVQREFTAKDLITSLITDYAGETDNGVKNPPEESKFRSSTPKEIGMARKLKLSEGEANSCALAILLTKSERFMGTDKAAISNMIGFVNEVRGSADLLANILEMADRLKAEHGDNAEDFAKNSNYVVIYVSVIVELQKLYEAQNTIKDLDDRIDVAKSNPVEAALRKDKANGNELVDPMGDEEDVELVEPADQEGSLAQAEVDKVVDTSFSGPVDEDNTGEPVGRIGEEDTGEPTGTVDGEEQITPQPGSAVVPPPSSTVPPSPPVIPPPPSSTVPSSEPATQPEGSTVLASEDEGGFMGDVPVGAVGTLHEQKDGPKGVDPQVPSTTGGSRYMRGLLETSHNKKMSEKIAKLMNEYTELKKFLQAGGDLGRPYVDEKGVYRTVDYEPGTDPDAPHNVSVDDQSHLRRHYEKYFMKDSVNMVFARESMTLEIQLTELTPKDIGAVARILSMQDMYHMLMDRFTSLCNFMNIYPYFDGKYNFHQKIVLPAFAKKKNNHYKRLFSSTILGQKISGQSESVPAINFSPLKGGSIYYVLDDKELIYNTMDLVARTFMYMACAQYGLLSYCISRVLYNVDNLTDGVKNSSMPPRIPPEITDEEPVAEVQAPPTVGVSIEELLIKVYNAGMNLPKGMNAVYRDYSKYYDLIVNDQLRQFSQEDIEELYKSLNKDYSFLISEQQVVDLLHHVGTYADRQYFDKIESLGEDEVVDLDILTDEEHFITPIYLGYYSKFMDNFGKSQKEVSVEYISKEVNKSIIEAVKENSAAVGRLFDKISDKIGGKSFKDIAELADKKARRLGRSVEMETIANYLKLLNQGRYEEADALFADDDTPSVGGSYRRYMKGGALQKVQPRLTQFMAKLYVCMSMFEGFILNNNPHLKKIFSTDDNFIRGTLDKDNRAYLLTIYSQLLTAIEMGKKSFMKILPMMFFTVEFPRQIYLDKDPQQKHYKFYYEDLLVKRQEMLNAAPVADGLDTYRGAHMAFLTENKMSDTSNILKNPDMSIASVLDMGFNPNIPEQMVVAMMFALGASGTGKTTRFFGLKGGNEANKTGIVNYVIKNTGASHVQLSYFVCYGQKRYVKTEIPEGVEAADAEPLVRDNSDFEEMLLFYRLKGELGADNIGSADDKVTPFVMQKSEPSTGTETFTQYYASLMNKKLDKLPFGDKGDNGVRDFIRGYISSLDDLRNEAATPEKRGNYTPGERNQFFSFKDVLESCDEGVNDENKKCVWMDINEQTPLDDLFETLLGRQKKYYTVMPTKNNIESSRGHTCVLIRFKKDATSKWKYFPLFDMAGTEDPIGIKDFTRGMDPKQFAKFIMALNRATSEGWQNTTTRGEGPDKKVVTDKVTSLNDVFVNPNSKIQEFIDLVYPGGAPAVGGGAEIKTILGKTPKKLENKELDLTAEKDIQYVDVDPSKDSLRASYNIEKSVVDDDSYAGRFIEKTIKEGWYINHTIATITEIALLVGNSINSEVKGDKDYFDHIMLRKDGDPEFKSVVEQVYDNNLCLVANENGEEQGPSVETITADGTPYNKQMTCNDSRLLLDGHSFDDMLNKNCLWAQVIFSFLYWSAETPISRQNLFRQYSGLDDDGNAIYESAEKAVEERAKANKYINQLAYDVERTTFPGAGIPLSTIYPELLEESNKGLATANAVMELFGEGVEGVELEKSGSNYILRFLVGSSVFLCKSNGAVEDVPLTGYKKVVNEIYKLLKLSPTVAKLRETPIPADIMAEIDMANLRGKPDHKPENYFDLLVRLNARVDSMLYNFIGNQLDLNVDVSGSTEDPQMVERRKLFNPKLYNKNLKLYKIWKGEATEIPNDRELNSEIQNKYHKVLLNKSSGVRDSELSRSKVGPDNKQSLTSIRLGGLKALIQTYGADAGITLDDIKTHRGIDGEADMSGKYKVLVDGVFNRFRGIQYRVNFDALEDGSPFANKIQAAILKDSDTVKTGAAFIQKANKSEEELNKQLASIDVSILDRVATIRNAIVSKIASATDGIKIFAKQMYGGGSVDGTKGLMQEDIDRAVNSWKKLVKALGGDETDPERDSKTELFAKVVELNEIYNVLSIKPGTPKFTPEIETRQAELRSDECVAQLFRVKDAILTATTMILMHLITGQNFKKDMVEGTLGLVQSLYDAVDIKAPETSTEEEREQLIAMLIQKAAEMGIIGGSSREEIGDIGETS